MDEWVPQPLVDEPNEVDKFTLSTVPVIHGANGLRVKLAPNGKSVSLKYELRDYVSMS